MEFIKPEADGKIRISHMTCRELAEYLDDYLANSLDAQRRDAFEAHLQDCSECVKYLSSYRRTIEIAKAAMAQPSTESAPQELPDGLKRAILAVRKGK
jgi:anti-sigma factor RsiW